MEDYDCGAGEMGCLLAAFLAKGKQEVWLLDKNPRARGKRLESRGCKVEGIGGSWLAKVNSAGEAKEIGGPGFGDCGGQGI